MLETDICKHTALTTKRKIIYFVAIGVGVFCFFALLALGLINKSPVTSQSGVTRVGKVAPGFEMPLIKGGDFVMADHTGRPMIVNFWASWCLPCEVEHPILMSLKKDSDIKIIGINYKDKREDADSFLTNEGNPYHVILYDIDGSFGIEMGIIGVPETFIVTDDGKIIYRHVGPLSSETRF